MRLILGLLIAFAAIVGYGGWRYQRAKAVELQRVAAVKDSIRRADSAAAARANGGQRPVLMVTDEQSTRPQPLKLPRTQPKFIKRAPAPTNRRP